MSDGSIPWITLRALLRLYRIELRSLADGRRIGRHPMSVRPGAELTLSADGGTWSTNDTSPITGDRLDFVMCMECVTRERASELLTDTFPAALKRAQIPEEG
jgi:hypothetical protein